MKAVYFQQIVSNVMALGYYFGIAPADGVAALAGDTPLTPRHNTARLALPGRHTR